MSGFIIKKASKKAKKLRVLLSASSGSGKTYGALLMAHGLCGDWTKICVIDTERDSASIYSDFGDYTTISLNAPYTPERYIEAIKVAESEGMECIIIDSITHEWNGEGGCLEIHSKLGGTFQNWGSVTPRHNKFIDKMLTSSAHIFATVRRKEEYTLSTLGNGKTQVIKSGLAEVQRDGISYEFDVVFEITNHNHLASVSKDRTRLFTDKPEFLIDESTGAALRDWASSGRTELDEGMDAIRKVESLEDLKTVYENYPGLHGNEDFKQSVKIKKEQLNK
jgi:hypothetical protein